jgi:ferric-dicitrate binding protein FerR (iron transport regulator)
MQEKIKDKGYWDTQIIDSLSDSISEENSRELALWFDESTKHLLYFNQMKEMWNSTAVADPNLPFDYEKAYSLFSKRVEEKTKLTLQKNTKAILWRRISIAAAVIIPFVILNYNTLFNAIPVESTKLALTEIISPNGSKTQLRLADGTIVWLNSGSQLLYNDAFGKENRNIELIGEAYLNVAHNEQVPLILKVGGLDIKVLGTKFNVNAYPEANDVKVSLLEGSVSMSTDNGIDPAILKPMETGIYQTSSLQISVKPGLSSNALSWMKNELIFTGETFEEIARILERRFDVKINIQNETLQKRCFGGDFGDGYSIEQILNIMAVNGKFNYTTKNNKIEIY